MPELPEVETVCQELAKVLSDQQIQEITLRRENLRYPFPYLMPERLQGATILGIRRRAKYILIDLSTADTWLIHLGMSGKFHEVKETPGKHDHLLLLVSSGLILAYNDPRRFGYMAVLPTAQVETSPYCKELGKEPLDPDLTVAMTHQLFLNSKRPIKTALLEQQRLVGLGNIYVCESLWAAGISPFRESNSLSLQDWQRLLPEIQGVLRRAIAVGGSTLKDYKQIDGKLGYFQHHFSVYDCAGEACQTPQCDGTISRVVQSGRSTFYCSRCQK
ncbi:bifunctional DNA-formamidopyrimidine glycosylase/DNA-(apurinic or apyrimidinic site) lyase [Candidatus Paracaedibacter symbiosus]|uniref:bifunctional DNA-formamidopyrimidine glycosylase/DNA-(apurinic or apyrimidinic site) lyase n=1 Tax=Candidatus Paracaedibacter symbiosus TaxID=244582 RepID=UPI000509FB91|nr:bifunctional DNA-formamidopyrimidine glycosylase/DNA-(apurinic or apyrimidinic site) lyase [Candidatus Paracaedibacter symbiosus]